MHQASLLGGQVARIGRGHAFKDRRVTQQMKGHIRVELQPVEQLRLAGLPPLSGFLAKFAIVRAGVDAEQWVAVGVALVVSLLTLVSMTKIWVGAFWGDVEPVASSGRGIMRNHPVMSTATALVVLLSLAIALGAGPLYDFASKAAEQVLDVAGYVSAVKS